MDRKHFARLAGSGLAGLALGCGGSDGPTGPKTSGTSGNNTGNTGGNTGGNTSTNPFDSYTPQVNSSPYPGPDYFSAGQVSDSIGNVSFAEGQRINNFFLEGVSHIPLQNLEATLYHEDKGTGLLSVADPEGRFMPNLKSVGNSSSTDFLRIYHHLESPQISFGMFGRKILGALPSWDPEDVDDLPGHVYIGDWSFDDLRNFNNILKYGSLALTFINPGFSAAFALFSKTDFVLDRANDTILAMNTLHPEFEFRTNQEYSIYFPIDDAPNLLFFPSSMRPRNSIQDIKDLSPINKGNSWTFSDGRASSTSTVLGNKRVRGRNLVAIKSTGGIEEYFGFYGSSLFQHGFNFPGIGDIFYNPGIEMGDDRISLGKKYPFSSSIISSNPNISGEIKGEAGWHDRINLRIDGTPYGDCFALKYSYAINFSNGSQNVADTFVEDRWFAKNVGPVQIRFKGETAELVDYNIVSRSGQSSNSLSLSQEINPVSISPFSQSISELMQKLT